jgi:GntR family transcriptional regulator
MPTSIVISQTDGRPMYLQIMEQIRQRVGAGEWKPGDQIPSIRALAIELQVSVITVKRAYLELEREGVIVTSMEKGQS